MRWHCSAGQRRREAGLKQRDRLLWVPKGAWKITGSAASPEQPVRIEELGLYLPDSNLVLMMPRLVMCLLCVACRTISGIGSHGILK